MRLRGLERAVGPGYRATTERVARFSAVNESGANTPGLPGIAPDLALGDQDFSLVTNTLTFNLLGIMFPYPS